MMGSRAFFALMRRNWVYRKRHWLSSIFEMVLPFCFVWILVAIKNAANFDVNPEQPAFYPADEMALTPFSYNDYMIAIQAKRMCFMEKEDRLGITGLKDRGKGWQVPYVKCNSKLCQFDGQDARPFCEYSILAVTGANETDTGGQDRAAEFREWMYDRWPILLQQPPTQGWPLEYDFVQLFPDPSTVDTYIRRPDYGAVQVPKISMSIVFDGNSPNAYKYSLRQNSTTLNSPERTKPGRPVTVTTPPTNRLFNSFARTDLETCSRSPRDANLGPFQSSCTGQYVYNGVIATQRLVGDFILAKSGAVDAGYFVSDGGVQFVQFPQRAFNITGFFESIQDSAPLIVTLGYLYPVASMITYIVREKELRQKELMKMMSVTESDIGWSWFCTFAMFHLVSAACAAAVADVLYERSSLLLLWILWSVSVLGNIVFSMACSTITSRSARAVLVGLLVYFAGVFLTLAVDFRSGNPIAIAFVSLHPVTAFVYGIQMLGYLEDLEVGLTFDSIDYSESLSGLSMLDVYRFLVVDVFIWGLLSWYLNRAIPPEYGQALPFWFPFDSRYWFRLLQTSENVSDDVGPIKDDIPVEEVSDALKRQSDLGKSIEICNMGKSFGDKKAVDSLCLSMYSGQITALLGHNGAGKTTTIGMLTGAIAPTSGYATVAGKDIRTNMTGIRQDIGICLQHDCLFPQLTVREHIQFFARIKGMYVNMSNIEAERQVDKTLVDVALSEKRQTLSKNLSGGMKRKLSVAIAFCGGSKVVLLDEPTSGQDPFSRRFTWNVIRNYKKDRIIILTTHFMDEADILGDRIAIMAEGRLRCIGSSLFLKKTYGVGYQLTIEKYQKSARRENNEQLKRMEGEGVHSTLDVETDENLDRELKEIVKSAIQGSTVLSDAGSELSFQLPLSSSSSFAPMFADLDARVDSKAISCYGVSITTLNEVFLLVTRGVTPKHEFGPSVRSLRSNSVEGERNDIVAAQSVSDEDNHDASSDFALTHSDRLFVRHVIALMKKRGSYFRRDRKAWICTTIVPSLFVLIGFLIFAFGIPEKEMEPLTLSLLEYNPDLQKNSVSSNSPNNQFICQPGVCSHFEPLNIVNDTNEVYAYCGFESKLGVSLDGFTPSNATCSVFDSAAVISQIAANRNEAVVLDEASVQNISEGSVHLLGVSNMNPHSNYGAIWFTHFPDSVMSDGRSYNETVVEQCIVASSFLSYRSDCRRFGGIGYVVLFNFTALHSALLYETLANEAIARHATTNPDLVVQAAISPLPYTAVESGIGAAEDAFLVWFLVVISFPFIGGAFGSFVVNEKSSKAKHLQTVAGVEPSAYWLSTFLWDSFNYQIPLWTVVAQMFIFQVDILTTSKRDIFSGIVVILFLFGPALAAFSYCTSFAFQSASMCNMFVISSGFLIGMGGPLTCFILELLARDPRNPKPYLSSVADIITWVLRCTPSFCLGKGLFHAINIEFFLILEADESLTAWSEPILLYEVYFLAAQIVVYLLFAIQLDKWSSKPQIMSIWQIFRNFATFKWLVREQSVARIADFPADDDDVVAEEKLVLSGKCETDAIVIKSLTKVYDDGKVAVDNISLGIAPGECFGLLGINGAGKTTTMSMLTAEFPPTSGDAILGGFSVTHEPQKIRRLVGYCPQFDALYSCLTAREHLHLYGAVKGIPNNLLVESATKKLREVGLNEADWDRASSGFSGGMKRRLSLACATMGQPKLIFLDECSTGVDPVSRREIWQLVSSMVTGNGLSRQNKPSIILTTHSMDECEALCPRIGIMANGKLCCIGSAQHLKNKFGRGFQVELTTKIIQRDDSDFNSITEKIGQAVSCSTFAESESLNYQQCLTILQILTENESLSKLVCVEHPSGYAMWKDSTSPAGVSKDVLASFAASELRMLALERFVQSSFSEYVLRERQDTKVRFEICGERLRISEIFEKIEQMKTELFLADYGVSQTSLEQVFNMHAAAAENQKHGRVDAEASMPGEAINTSMFVEAIDNDEVVC